MTWYRQNGKLYKIAGKPVAPVMGATARAQQFTVPDGQVFDNQARLVHQLSWIYTAVMKTAELAAGAQFSVQRLSGEERQDVPNHPFERLLARPNPLQGRSEFLIATYAYRKINGNAYWWLNRTSAEAEPAELWLIPPARIRPIPDGRLFIRGYEYDPGDGQLMVLEPWEVMHFKNFHPSNAFIGMSAIESLATVATGDLQAQQWNAKFFGESNARLPGILAFADRFTETDWARIKGEVQSSAIKRELMLLQGVGTGQVNWLQNGVTQKDMEFLNARAFTKEEIYSVLAPGLASMLSINATEANAKTGKATLIEMEVWPMLVGVADKITADLLPVYGENLAGEFDDIRVTDRVLDLQEQQEYAKTHTVEEVRQKFYGDDPLGDERDRLLVAQVTPQSGGVNAPDPAIEPEAGGGQQPENIEERGRPDERADELDEELAKWRRKALKRLKEGRGAGCEFDSPVIPAGLAGAIVGQLEHASTPEHVKTVFDNAQTWREYP
jgi:HK97 family phage portal protein